MSSVLAAAQHVHLDIELEPDKVFRYWSRSRDGRIVRLGRGDTLTLTCAEPFSIQFPRASPFGARRIDAHRESVLHVREWFITATVREDALDGAYPYTVEATNEGRIFLDGSEDSRMLQNNPEIVVESSGF